MEENDNKETLRHMFRRKSDLIDDDTKEYAELYHQIRRNEFDLLMMRNDLETLKKDVLPELKSDLRGLHFQINGMEDSVTNLQGKIDKFDGRLWTIIMLIVGSIALPLILKYYHVG